MLLPQKQGSRQVSEVPSGPIVYSESMVYNPFDLLKIGRKWFLASPGKWGKNSRQMGTMARNLAHKRDFWASIPIFAANFLPFLW